MNRQLSKAAMLGVLALALPFASVVETGITNQSTSAIVAHAKTKAKTKDKKSSTANDADSTSGGTVTNPTSVAMDTYTKHTSYPLWLQYWGPWATNFGGKGHGGTNWGGGNLGCVSTSMAIQAARGGATKTTDGKEWNPLGTPMVNGATQNTYKTGNGLTITRDMKTGGGVGAGHTMSDKEALAEAQKIASRGDYPLIRMNQDGHTVAYWKAGNGKPLFYDPARQSYGNYAKGPINYVGAMTVKGKGAKKFNPNDPGPNNASGGDSSSSDKDSSKDSNSNQPAIKPIFNPFYSPTVHVLPADQNGDQTQTGAQVMAYADGATPSVLAAMRTIVYLTTWIYTAAIIVITLFALADYQSGFLLSDKLKLNTGNSTFRKLLFPGGAEGSDGSTLFGLETSSKHTVSPYVAIIISAMKKFVVIFLMGAFISVGGLSWAFSEILSFLNYILNII